MVIGKESPEVEAREIGDWDRGRDAQRAEARQRADGRHDVLRLFT